MPEIPTGNLEQEQSKERTKESEIKDNVEFWKKLGIEVDEADVRREIEAIPEVEGFDWYFYIPQGIEFDKLWDNIGCRKNFDDDESDYEFFKTPRSTDKSYGIASRYSQEPDEDSLGEKAKSAEDWEKTNDQFMNLLERLIAEMRWSWNNKGYLDEKFITICPGNRSVLGNVVTVEHEGSNLEVCCDDPSTIDARMGVRRVITKDTKIEQGETEE